MLTCGNRDNCVTVENGAVIHALGCLIRVGAGEQKGGIVVSGGQLFLGSSIVDCCSVNNADPCGSLQYNGILYVGDSNVVSMRVGGQFSHCSDSSVVTNDSGDAADPLHKYLQNFACCNAPAGCTTMPSGAPSYALCLS